MSVEREERFALALEECRRRLNAGESVEECIMDYPADFREELRALVLLTGRLNYLGHNPSPAFEARLQQTLLTEVDELRQKQKKSIWSSLGRRLTPSPLARMALTALLIVVVLVGGGVGLVQAADQSYPDSPLYGVKTASEWAEFTFARGEPAKVGVLAHQLSQRNRELRWAVRTEQKSKQVENLATRLGNTAERMVDQVLKARERGNAEAVIRADNVLRLMEREIQGLARLRASPDARTALEHLLVILQTQEQRLAAAGG